MTHVQLFIDGAWRDGADGAVLDFWNPVDGEAVGTVAKASKADLEQVAQAARKGFATWRAVPTLDRSRVLRKAAEILRSRVDTIGPLLTREQGKPLAEARGEVVAGADIIEWFARRLLHRLRMWTSSFSANSRWRARCLGSRQCSKSRC